jgi:NADPH:quinone reductase-like Zn-dependent oxidoreductase
MTSSAPRPRTKSCLAVQIAKARGAYVIGTASTAKHDFVRGLGADEVIDYRQTDFAEAVHDIDVALDTIGGEYQLRTLRTLRPGGMLVSVLTFPVPGLAEEADRLGVRTEMMLVEADHAGMSAIAGLAEAGALKPAIAGTFAMAQAAKAHELGETNRTTGKLVLVMDVAGGTGG